MRIGTLFVFSRTNIRITAENHFRQNIRDPRRQQHQLRGKLTRCCRRLRTRELICDETDARRHASLNHAEETRLFCLGLMGTLETPQHLLANNHMM